MLSYCVDFEPMGIQDNALPRLNVAIGNLNLAKEASSITPVKAAFGSAAVLIVMIRVRLLFYDEMFHVQG